MKVRLLDFAIENNPFQDNDETIEYLEALFDNYQVELPKEEQLSVN